MNLIVRPVAPEIEDEPAPISLRSVWAAAMRRWRMVSLVFGAIAAVALLIMAVQPPRYTAVSTIMIRPGAGELLTQIEPTSNRPANANTVSAEVDSEVEILRSRELASRVVERLGLVEDPEWNARRGTPLAIWFSPPVRASLTSDEVASGLARAVSVRRRALSEVVDVSVTASRPERAAEIANAYVQTYLEMSVEAKNARTEQAIQWLNQRLHGLQQDLQAKEAAVAAFRAESGLYVGAGESLSEQQVRAIQDSIVVARADLAERSARHAQLRALIARGGNADSISSALTSDVIRDLRREEATMSRTLAEMETRLTDSHPDVINGRQQLADVRGQIQAEMSRIAANAEGEVLVAQARLGTLEASLGSEGGRMGGAAEVRLAQLTREAVAARTVYEAFLQRYHQMVGQGETAPLQVRLVSHATPPVQASWPDWRLAFLIALACGLIGAGLVLLAVEMLTDPVASAEELEKRVGVATLAAVPLVERGTLRLLPPESRHPAGYLADKRFSAYAEAFRGLRTSLQFANKQGQVQVLVVTSAQPNEGKTTCALSLARASAMAGQRVILIDCDVRRRALNELLNIEPQRGLWHVLTGQADWRSIAGVDVATSAHILPSAPGDFASGDVLYGEAMDTLLAELRENYDVVVLDCPPVWALTDARLLAAKGDGVILVSRWNQTSVPSLAAAIRHLTPSGARVLGVVVNGVNGNVARWAGYSEYGFGSYASQYVVN